MSWNYTRRLIRGAISAMVVTAVLLLFATPAEAARIKDLAQIDGVRDNQLMGFGLIGGLAGTGDDPKSAPYTAEAIANMLAAFGFQIQPAQINVKNFAAVMVTANLPAYMKSGDRLDVTVSAIGSAKSLSGGMLYQTLLKGLDGTVYAVGQGPVSLGAVIGGGGAGGGQNKAHETVGRIPGGGLIENSVPSTVLKTGGLIVLNLNDPDFTTASAITVAINKQLGLLARAVDAGSVSVAVPVKYQSNLVPFIAALESIEARPGETAKVVINQRTGTVVVGQKVAILPVAVAHGAITLTFGEEVAAPGKPAEEEAVDNTAAGTPPVARPGVITATPSATLLPEEKWKLAPTTAEHVALGLNRMKLKPQDIVAIFEAIDAAGALMGELEII
jgi:flagellar P-ring protein FlgI